MPPYLQSSGWDRHFCANCGLVITQPLYLVNGSRQVVYFLVGIMSFLLSFPAFRCMPLNFEQNSTGRVSPTTVYAFVFVTVPAGFQLDKFVAVY